MRVAAIDCGTNSLRLLVTDIDTEPATGAATEREVVRAMTIVRLGEGVDRTGELSAGALERTFAACREYARQLHALGNPPLRFVATSATRDAGNRDRFVAGVEEILGVTPEVISGDEEAALSFVGATRELTSEPTGAGASSPHPSRASSPHPSGASTPEPHPSPYLVVDIGGGSTEFVLGDTDPIAARSVDLGCVRLTERLLTADPPTDAQLAAAVAEVDARIDEAARTVPMDRARTLVGLAGSVTTVAGIALGLEAYDPKAIHRSRIAADDVHAITERLLASTHDARLAIPVMHPGRADVIGAGALILDRILRRVRPTLAAPEVLASEHDILDGIAWSLASGRRATHNRSGGSRT